MVVYLLTSHPAGLSLVLWMSLASLFAHQFEEYRYPGYFPGMFNSVMFSSERPDRYPLNANTAVVINLGVGWVPYFLAALFGTGAIWLGIGSILISVGNFVLHTFVFTIRGRRIYNPGLLTSVVLFLPVSAYFFYLVLVNGVASTADWVLGIGLGIVLFYVGIVKVNDWLKDENTPYVFPERFLMK